MTQAARHYRWDDMPKEKLNDLLDRRLVTGDRMMLAHVYLKKGCVVPRHSARERAAHLHPRGRAALLDRRGRDARRWSCSAGEVLHDPVESAAQGRGARGHARRRHLQPAAAGLARQDRRLPAEVALSVDLGLRDKVALVAAASRGLGRAIAEELAAEGAAIVMCARERERADAGGARDRGATGARVVAGAPPTCRELDDVAASSRRALDEFGRVDVLVTNSGGPPAGTLRVASPEAWKAAVDVLLTSAVELIAGACCPG